MRVFKQTIILLLVFAAIAGFYFLYLKPHEEKKKKIQEDEKKLINIDQEKIREIWITKQDGEKIGFRKESKNRWSIIYPFLADADRFSVNPIASRYSSIEIERLINEAGDFAPYGLDKPRFIVELKTDEQSFSIRIGNKSQVGYSVYVQKEGDNRVFLVSAAIEASIDKPFSDFRERRPMDFITTDVKKLIISRGDKKFLFERQETNDWVILFPDLTTFAEADDSKIRDLLYKISGIKVKEFISDVTEPKYGLDIPDMTLNVYVSSKDQELEEFSIHLKFADGQVYAKKPDKPNIFSVEVDKSIQEPILSENFRNRQVIKFYVWRVKEISIETPTESRIIQRDPVDTEKWYLVLSGGEKKNLETSKVKESLSKLSDISVLKFLGDNVDVAEFVKNPIFRVRINVEGRAEPYYLLLGEKSSDGGVSGIVGGLMDKKSVYLFPSDITSIIQAIKDIQPVN